MYRKLTQINNNNKKKKNYPYLSITLQGDWCYDLNDKDSSILSLVLAVPWVEKVNVELCECDAYFLQPTINFLFPILCSPHTH